MMTGRWPISRTRSTSWTTREDIREERASARGPRKAKVKEEREEWRRK